MFKLLKNIHAKFIFSQRIERLSSRIASLVPNGSTILDIGCGTGQVGFLVRKKKKVHVQGVELALRENCLIDVVEFDGRQLPFEADSFDVCMFVDVLHHTDNVKELVKEACRVSRELVIVKDHNYANVFEHLLLKVMDWVGNRPHGVILPYNFLKEKQWENIFSSAGLVPVAQLNSLRLYPPFIDFFFGGKLHFLVCMRKQRVIAKS